MPADKGIPIELQPIRGDIMDVTFLEKFEKFLQQSTVSTSSFKEVIA
jgi:hypothetical protein